ncbi:MAG: lysostaphin resistance A-like protein [bacterium]
MAYSYREQGRVIRSETFAFFDLSHVTVLLAILSWLLFDWFFFPLFNPHMDRIEFTVLLRDTLLLGVVIFSIGFLQNHWKSFTFDWTTFFGRIHPRARLILTGFGSFLLLGALIWGVSYFYPIKIQLPKRPITVWNVLLVVVLIPLLEEILFRNYLYCYLRNHVGVTAGIFITSLVFSGLHGLTFTTLFIFAGAVMMSSLYEVSGSILPGWTAHACFNAALFHGYIWL